MLVRCGSFLYRSRWLVLWTALALLFDACIFGFGVFGLVKNNSNDDPNSPSMQAQQQLSAKLGGTFSDVFLVMHHPSLHATDPAFADAADQLLNQLHSRPEVAGLISYYSTYNPALISRDGHETFAILQLASQDSATKAAEYEKIKPLLTSSLLQITTGGNIPVSQAIGQQVSSDLEKAEMVTFPILAILLLLVFGGVIAAALPLFIGGAAILVTFTVLRLLTKCTDISSYALNVVTMLGLGLAIDYALLLITRFREELEKGQNDVEAALERTMATAGRTIIFSALTVSTSLLSLLLFPLTLLRSMGLGAIAAVMVVMITSITLLPALLALLGTRINALSFRYSFQWRKRQKKLVPLRHEQRGIWYLISEMVMRWPGQVALGVLILLLVLGWPFLHIHFATPDEKVLPPDQPARQASEELRRNFAQQGNSQLVIAVTTPGSALDAVNLASLDSYVRTLSSIPGVEHVESLVTVDPGLTLTRYQYLYAHPQESHPLAQVAQQLASGDLTKVTVELEPQDHSAAAIAIVNRVRALTMPGGLVALVDGITPEQIDLLASLGNTLPEAMVVILVSIFVLLFLMTGSFIMPLKAILLNILSLSATFGGLVWIFQDGHLHHLLNFQSVGSIDATQPVLIFAIAFGLSMDYEVFLLSRIKERFDQTGNNRIAVSSGLQRTGWLITSEALLLAIVLGAFGTARIIFIQEIGIGLTIAIIMDATLIRMLLVPATMRLLGNINWWAPAPFQRLWRYAGLSESTVEAQDTMKMIQAYETQPLRRRSQIGA